MQSVASITTERAIFSFHFFSLIWNENWRKTNVSEWKSCPQPTAHISIHFYFQNGPAANKKCRFLQYCNIANRSWQFFGFNFHESISRRLFAASDHFFFVFKEWRIIYMPNKVKFQRFNRQSCTKQLHRIFIALAVKPISQMNSISIKYPKAF